MNLRTAAVAVVAVCASGLPATAMASPLPDPPPRTSPAVDPAQGAVRELMQAHRLASVQQKRGIHNEIVLLEHVGRAAL